MKHCIIVKWNEDVDKKNILIPIKELYSGALDIPGISGVTFIENCIDIKNRYDIMIQIEIEKDKLEFWNQSEIHKTWKEKYGDKIMSKAIFDYE
ncbi:MAG: hypothetical protein MJ143_03005, partial [Clostridia bacterium]|nr:hypothetical protein [Clostridia bacterium]